MCEKVKKWASATAVATAIAAAGAGNAGAQQAPNLNGVIAPFVVDTTIDLGDVQTALQNQLNGIRKVERCADNYNVWDAKVLPNGGSVKVDFQARYYLNKCAIVTLPEFRDLRITFHDHVIGETILFSQAGHIAVDVTPSIQDGVVTVDTDVVTADMDGLLGRLKLNGQVKAFLNDKIRDALKAQLTTTLPPEVMKAGVQFSEISFVDLGAGKLGLKVKATGKLNAS
jgi:hypothetical protein